MKTEAYGVKPTSPFTSRLRKGSTPIEESALAGPAPCMAATKMSRGLNVSMDGLAVSPQTYETVAFMWSHSFANG